MADKKYVIDQDKIHNGDIILIISDRRLSAIMERTTGCKYHHALMQVATSSYIHSYQLGVQSDNTARRTFERPDDAVALRLKSNDGEIIRKAINAIRVKVPTQYSLEEMKRVLNAGDIEAEEANRQFCTRLVAQAYREAGVDLVKNADYCSLADLLASDEVTIIDNVLREGSKEELAYANSENEMLDKQKAIQNSILEQARALTRTDIQTFEQLEEFVIKNPENDEAIENIIRDSGYLDQWRVEMEKNPQNYDFEHFAAYYPSAQWLEVAVTYMEVASPFTTNLPINIIVNEKQYERYGLRYHKTQIELLENLMQQFTQMENTMEAAIERAVNV